MKTTFLKTCCVVVALLCATSTLNAQISHGGAPMFNHSKAAVKTSQLPGIDNDVYLQEDVNMVKGSSPLRVGVMQDVNISNITDGELTTLANGTRVWRMAVNSPNAQFLSLTFSTFDIPEGAQLFVYDASGDFVLGAFTRANTLQGNKFYTQAVPGSKAIIEYIEPSTVAGQGRLVLSRVCHGYKNIFQSMNEDLKGQLGDAEGTCHINVKCAVADDWRDQIRSVVALQIIAGEYSFMCSGSLINNTAQDRTPYVLSAYHCQDLSEYNVTVEGWVTYFNYQTSQCSNNAGPCNNSITGATILAKNSSNGGSDFLLLRLNDTVPASFKPYYSGWDRSSNSSPTVGTCIHHPGGDFKKISFPQSITRASGSYTRFWNVSWFTGTNNKGVTEQGSSGSPLFNGEKRIIGQLFAGSSACDNLSGTDLYGRVYSSWTGAGSSESRLKDWLDPAGTNVETLDGLNYQTLAIDDVETTTIKIFPNPSHGMVYLDVNDLGMANYKVFDLNGRCVKEGRTVLTTTNQALNLTSLPAGAYSLVLYTSANTYSQTIIIK